MNRGLPLFGALLLSACGARESGAPAVIIERVADKAAYELIDVPVLPELNGFEMASSGSGGDAPIRYSKDGNSVRYEVWLDDVHYVTAIAAISEVSAKKSELDVNVTLEDSPFTEDYGLLESDIPLLEDMLDAALTEYIAAKLEERRPAHNSLDGMQARIDFATFMQREAFERRVERAMEGAFKPIAEKYAADGKRRFRRQSSSLNDTDYRGYAERERIREAQRDASRPMDDARPTTELPSSR